MLYRATTQKTFTDSDGTETLYTFSALDETVDNALFACTVYASMVEYGLIAEKWQPSDDMFFPKEQLYQFIQPSQLDILERMYPDCIGVAYQNALAYIQSYIGNMFNVDDIIAAADGSSTAFTLRLALVIQTAIYLLASSPQYAETIELHNKQLHMLLRGLKSGSRNFGKNAEIEEPNARVQIVNLSKTAQRP